MTTIDYPKVLLFIDGEWSSGSGTRSGSVPNPATGQEIGMVPFAEIADLDRAADAAVAGFKVWRAVSAYDRYRLMRNAAQLLRDQVEAIAPILTLEQGKVVAEARAEIMGSADVIDWYAEEGRRAYGRIIPSRSGSVHQSVLRQPVGPVLGLSPWNFPIGQAVRKIAGALAAGCSIVIKGPEETPASCVALVKVFEQAGLPKGVLNLVFGVPAEVSSHLIAHPAIRKVSFTGSTAVGKQLAALAGEHMKRVTMELGGNAPAIVFADADVEQAARILSFNKYRNAGQICASPSRFLVHESLYDRFAKAFAGAAKALKVGDGLTAGNQMGPLANPRRVSAMERLVADARSTGAKVLAGGERGSNAGNFFQPTVLGEVSSEALIMNDEPFGPVAPIARFQSVDAVVEEANRVEFGLCAYIYTRSPRTAAEVSEALESGSVGINHHGVGLPESPFGGVKASGYGIECGAEALDAYLVSKFVTADW